MAAASQIQYVPYNNIDKIKWDTCVASTKNSLVYNRTWFLDAMAPHWDGLVMNDYEAVMPLVWNKKYSFRYLYQPFFAAQVGISGKNSGNDYADAFLHAVPAHFKFIDINLDENNRVNQFQQLRTERVNMLLDITDDHAELKKNYHRLATRMIKKAMTENIAVETNASISSNIAFFRQHYQAQVKIPQRSYNNLTEMFGLAAGKQQVISLAAKKGNTVLAVYMLLADENNVYSVIGGSSPEGKKAGAFYLLTDYAIQTTAGRRRVFRFEGSDIAGIADFNKQFGPTSIHYDHIKINRLPFPISRLKK